MQYLALALCLVACGEPLVEGAERRKPRVDAAASSDSSTTTGGDPAQAGVVACYSTGAPSRTCTLPVHCCFFNYSAQHDGYCTNETCSWGTILCDGPEDCSNG